jgi:hypothetical protein
MRAPLVGGAGRGDRGCPRGAGFAHGQHASTTFVEKPTATPLLPGARLGVGVRGRRVVQSRDGRAAAEVRCRSRRSPRPFAGGLGPDDAGRAGRGAGQSALRVPRLRSGSARGRYPLRGRRPRPRRAPRLLPPLGAARVDRQQTAHLLPARKDVLARRDRGRRYRRSVARALDRQRRGQRARRGHRDPVVGPEEEGSPSTSSSIARSSASSATASPRRKRAFINPSSRSSAPTCPSASGSGWASKATSSASTWAARPSPTRPS